MGTRAITTIKNNNNETLVVLYRQSDGCQDCHGKDLKDFILPLKLVNGFSGMDKTNMANGMGCLAAQLISKLKDKPGLFYIYPEGEADDWVDFYYTIYPADKSYNSAIKIKVESYGNVMFDGLVSDYDAKDSYEED